MSKRREVSTFWDEAVRGFLAGERPHLDNPDLRLWYGSYAGGGSGSVTPDAFPEPYVGPLSPELGEPRVVALGLNPGEADLEYQGRSGVFGTEITELGSYAAWAATEPYLREPWASTHRRNRYHVNLRTFAQRWTTDQSVGSRDVLVLELYPWHSTSVTARMRPDPELIDRYVWQPLAEIDVPIVFAFGKDWRTAARDLALTQTRVEAAFGSSGRHLETFTLPSGQHLAVVWQSGYAGPPGGDDVAVLQRALTGQSHAGSTGRRPKAVKEEAVMCVHEMAPGTCGICSTPKPSTQSRRSPRAPETPGRSAYTHALGEHASQRLRTLRFGPVRVPASGGFAPIKWPARLWYRQFTQNDDVHLKLTDEYLQFRVHIDAFPGDRVHNNAAFDIIRDAIENDLLVRLPDHDAIDWRAAGGGNNQVCTVTRFRSASSADAKEDARWVVAVADAWLQALEAHPIPDLRQRAVKRSQEH